MINPKKCAHCERELKKRHESKKGYCSPSCEILGKTIETESGCWEWQGQIFKQYPYGMIAIDGKKDFVHRVAYKCFRGVIPDGLYIRHLCNNPCCCNPDHLEVGTQFDNIQDAIKCGTIKPKLSWDQVCKIRAEFVQAETSYNAIGKKYGVHAATVRNIILMNKRKEPPPGD